MNRQYIGMEKMDYIETVAVERLKKVICGEQGGISKSVNWQGGGSFVYMELAKKNERAVELISSCENLDDLVKIFDTLSKKYFLHYNVRVKEFRNEIATSKKFAALPLEHQKNVHPHAGFESALCECLRPPRRHNRTCPKRHSIYRRFLQIEERLK